MIIRGQDYDMTFPLELDDETVLQPSTLEELYLYVIHVKRFVTLDKFSMNAKAGYETITIDDDANGIVTVILGHDITRYAPVGKVKVEMMAIMTDADYPDSQQKIICTLDDDDWYITESKIKVE